VCACGCQRHAHANGGIGECVDGGESCHGCPEYRPATRRRFVERDDEELETMDVENLRGAYRMLRAHHIEETSAMYDDSMREPAERVYEHVLHVRDIEDFQICPKCKGYGTTMYPNTSGWRRSAGGAMMTTDVCDQCWGSGNKDRPWNDLRKMQDTIERRIAERAVDALARSCAANASMTSTHKSIREIIAHLDAMKRKRKVDFWTRQLVIGLANILRRAIGDPEDAER
jgi:hypothetical protein